MTSDNTNNKEQIENQAQNQDQAANSQNPGQNQARDSEKQNNNQSQAESFWFKITKKDQYITVNELMSESNDPFTYFFLLVLSSIIIAAGILLANSAILIGGMLITPLLSPVLLISLGMTIGNANLIKRSVIKILKSLAVILLIAFFISLVFKIPQDREFFNSALFTNTADSAFLYFIVAFASGIAATFAWIRKKVDNLLPGIAIAVSLVPPVSMVGVFIGSGDPDLARFFLMVFLFNITGIIGGSMILFSMFKFYNSEKAVEKNLEKIEKETQAREEQKRLADLEKQKDNLKEAEAAISHMKEEITLKQENLNEKHEKTSE